MRYLFIILICCGCYLPKQAANDLRKVERHYPDLLKKKAAELYPLKIKVDSIPVIRWRDSIINIIKHRNDTIISIINSDSNCDILRRKLRDQDIFINGLEEQLNNIPIVYKIIEDSSKIYLLSKRIEEQTNAANWYRKKSSIFIYYSTCISIILILLLLAIAIRLYFGSKQKLH